MLDLFVIRVPDFLTNEDFTSMSIRFNLSLRLLDAVLLNLSLIPELLVERDLDDIAFLEPLLPLIRETGVFQF